MVVGLIGCCMVPCQRVLLRELVCNKVGKDRLSVDDHPRKKLCGCTRGREQRFPGLSISLDTDVNKDGAPTEATEALSLSMFMV